MTDLPKGRPVVVDEKAFSAHTGVPAFIARLLGAPVYCGFPLVQESATDGWVYGAITAFEGVEAQEAGDGFVVAPDGSRAGIAWSTTSSVFSEIMPPEPTRWGVYNVRFPKALNSRADLVENFRAVQPLLPERFAIIRARNV